VNALETSTTYSHTVFTNTVGNSLSPEVLRGVANAKGAALDASARIFVCIVYLLLCSCKSFIGDLEASDRQHTTLTGSVLADQNDGTKSGEPQDDELPVEELVVSAHLCMLLGTLAMKNDQASSSECPFSVIGVHLPRQCWWLVMRVLKAFIVLQRHVSLCSSKSVTTSCSLHTDRCTTKGKRINHRCAAQGHKSLFRACKLC
jgi:hypothetical protein